jgi:hypothetical protein
MCHRRDGIRLRKAFEVRLSQFQDNQSSQPVDVGGLPGRTSSLQRPEKLTDSMHTDAARSSQKSSDHSSCKTTQETS